MADQALEGAQAYATLGNTLQTQQDNWRKNAAMAALTKQYGPTAGDPDDTAKVQANYLATQVDPLKVAQAQRENTANDALVSQYGPTAGDPAAASTMQTTSAAQGDQQRQAAYRAVQMLKSAAGPDGTVPPGAFDQVIAPNAGVLGIDPTHVAPLRAMLTQPGGSQHLDTIANALLGPTKVSGSPIVAQDANGQSILVNHDQYGRPITSTLAPGVTPVAQQRANTANAAQQSNADRGWAGLGVRQQNADTNTYRASVTGNNSSYGAGDGVNLPAQGAARAAFNVPANGVPVNVKAPDGSTVPFDEASAHSFITSAFPGSQITSGLRLQAKNASLPGSAPDSEHLYGQAADVVLPKGTSFQEFKQTLSQAGLPTTELQNVTPANAAAGEGAHVHWAWGDAAKNPQAQPQTGGNPQGATVFDRLPMKGRSAAISQATQLSNQASNLSNTNKIIDQVAGQITPYTAGTGSLLKDLPGTAQKDLQANLATLKAQGLTSWIQSLKNQQGQTGVGRVLQSEANAAMNLYGNMEQDQSAKQLQFHLSLFKQAVNNLAAHARAGFTQMYGKSPEGALGLPEATSGTGSAPQPQYNQQQQALLSKYGIK